MVIPNPQGRFIYYRANYDVMNDLLTYLTLNCCAGQQSCCDTNPMERKESTS